MSTTAPRSCVERSLGRHTPVWTELFPRERARIMALLIECVTVDARQEEVALTFHASGIRELLADAQEEAA